MPTSILKKNKELLREKALVDIALKEAGKGVLDRDDPHDRDAETIQTHCRALDLEAEKLLCFPRLLCRIPLPEKSKAIKQRGYAVSKYDFLRRSIESTSKRRLAYGDITAVAFGTRMPSLSASMLCSTGNEWKVNIIVDSYLSRSPVWSLFGYTTDHMSAWWAERKGRSQRAESPAWSDMQVLCKAVVYFVESIDNTCEGYSSATINVKEAGEKIRVTTIKLIALLSDYPDYLIEIAKGFEELLAMVFAGYCFINALENWTLDSQASWKLHDHVASEYKILCERSLQHTSDLTADIKFRFMRTRHGSSEDNQVSYCFTLRETVARFFVLVTIVNKHVTVSDFSALGVDYKVEMLESAGHIALNTGLVQNQEQFQGLLSKRNASEAAKVFDHVNQYLSMKSTVLDTHAFESLGLRRIYVAAQGHRRLGNGSFSVVDEYLSRDGQCRYAVKIATCHDGIKRTFNRVGREASVWRLLDHPNIQELLGYCMVSASPYPALVMDVCLDNLGAYLEVNPSIDEHRKLLFVKDIADGMDYLHSEDIAHGDLRRANILVKPVSESPGSRAVLSDFGVAYPIRSLHDPSQRTSCMDPTVNQKTNDAWLAPEFFSESDDISDGGSDDSEEESLNSVTISFAADVYAFGCVVLEVMVNEAPFANIRVGRLSGLKRKGTLPAARSPRNEFYYDLLSKCWAQDPHDRPDSRIVVEDVDTLLKKIRAPVL